MTNFFGPHLCTSKFSLDAPTSASAATKRAGLKAGVSEQQEWTLQDYVEGSYDTLLSRARNISLKFNYLA